MLPILMTMLHSNMAGVGIRLINGQQLALNFLDQQVGVAWLDHDLIEAGFPRSIELFHVRIAGRCDEGNVGRLGVGAQALGDVEAGDARQLEIKDDQVGTQAFGLRECGGAIDRGGDAIAQGAQVNRPDIEGVWVIVDDQYMSAGRHGYTPICPLPFHDACQAVEDERACYAFEMPLNLAQVLNTLAHEIRTPLAVSQGYLKLYLDGRLTNVDDTRRAFEQTRQALGTLATLCVDMGKVSALSEGATRGIPERVSAADFVKSVQAQSDIEGATWTGDAGTGAIEAVNARELAEAVAIVAKAAFDEAREAPKNVRTEAGAQLTVLAGANDSLAALQSGPGAPEARPVDFAKGGKGLKLIWAAFVLNKHQVQTWTVAEHRASVGFRFPLVKA